MRKHASWRMYAPRPDLDASTCSLTGLVGSNNFRIGWLDKIPLRRSTDGVCSCDQVHAASFFKFCRNGAVISDCLGINWEK